jgi:hypothetical protein
LSLLNPLKSCKNTLNPAQNQPLKANSQNDTLHSMNMDQYPEFTRLPSKERGAQCDISRLTRSQMESLIRPQAWNNYSPPVESKVLKLGGIKRGVRLVRVSSLLAYLNSLPSEVSKTPPSKPGRRRRVREVLA